MCGQLGHVYLAIEVLLSSIEVIIMFGLRFDLMNSERGVMF